MKHFFSKSFALLLFSFSLSFVISLAGSLVWSVSNRPNATMKEQDSFVVSFAAGVFLILLLLNAADIVLYWLRGKKRELYVKQLVGIEPSRIMKALYINFVLLTAPVSLCGTALACAATSVCSGFLPIQVNLGVFLFSFLFCLLILLAFCIVIVLRTPALPLGEN